eukprot:3145548-Pyramimonas_sp.AAC.1
MLNVAWWMFASRTLFVAALAHVMPASERRVEISNLLGNARAFSDSLKDATLSLSNEINPACSLVKVASCKAFYNDLILFQGVRVISPAQGKGECAQGNADWRGSSYPLIWAGSCKGPVPWVVIDD